MKGLGTAGMIMIIVTGMTGLLLILMSSVGVTPPYYHSLPEMKYIDMLSSYNHLTENAERSINSGSEEFFSSSSKHPLKWENWPDADSFKSDFETIFSGKLENMALDYLNSVSQPEQSVTVDFATINSSMSYDSGTKKLDWNYTYGILLFVPLHGKGEKLHSINTTEKITASYDFLDLDKVYACANDFFDNLENFEYGFKKSEKSRLDIERELEADLHNNLNSFSNCNNFDLDNEVDVIADVSCSTSECTCRSVEEAEIILVFKNKNTKRSLAFSDTFNNFRCWELVRGCQNGKDCCVSGSCNRDCVAGVCSNCWSGSVDYKCSPKGNPNPTTYYKCYKTDSGEYKCLDKYENIFYKHGGSNLYTLDSINVNCGSVGTDYLEIEGGSENYKIDYNGVEIGMNTQKIDLCDDSIIPRKDGELGIHIASDYDDTTSTYYYKIDDININFALSEYIEKLNKDLKGDRYFFDTDYPSENEIENHYKDHIVGYLNRISADSSTFEFKGYSIDVTVEEVNCNIKFNSKAVRGYSIIKVEFKELDGDKEVAALQYLIPMVNKSYLSK